LFIVASLALFQFLHLSLSFFSLRPYHAAIPITPTATNDATNGAIHFSFCVHGVVDYDEDSCSFFFLEVSGSCSLSSLCMTYAGM
jgi:hypothetical protein